MTKKKKTSREKRALIGAVCTAAVILAGSTFAWFTSTDEVTNRLSASADYGTAVVENFEPEENWSPGQKVNKDVAVVNTGNVDSLVRVWLEGEMNLVTRAADASKIPANVTTYTVSDTAVATKISPLTDTDAGLANYGYKLFGATGSGTYVKELDKTTKKINNSNSVDTTGAYTEVQALQSGGYLAYAPSGAKYQYTLNQRTAVNIYPAATGDAAKTDVDAGVTIDVGATQAAYNSTTKTYTAPSATYGDIDSDSFLPKTTGLYLFRRNVDVKDGTSDENWKYTGYYYVAADNDAGGQGTYYALDTESTTTNYVNGIVFGTNNANVNSQTGALNDTAVANVKLFTAARKTVKNSDLVWTYDADSAVLTARYGGADTKVGYQKANDDATVATNYSADDIIIDIQLVKANIGTAEENWSVLNGTGATTPVIYKSTDISGDAETINAGWTFYYNNDLEEGATTAQLVDSVTLNKSVTQESYIAFDFDLNVILNSVQVTKDETGKETITAATETWSTSAGNETAIGAGTKVTDANYTGNEINIVSWTTSAT